ncbi:MAG: heavy metal-binding domain-containing protein [Verrucomicrobia bacterium]|nr:heavy metal-binding domain-containing protein [Verrucomicrobiota bacterium]MCH8513031.1 YbjQ family protein [Kiritimatiellia bacterium]
MSHLLLFLVYFVVPLLLLVIAFFGGNAIALNHNKRLEARQQLVDHIRITDLKGYIRPQPGRCTPGLFCAEITLGIDHFRGFLGKLKNILGGEVKSYEKTLDRARREAILQVMEQAHAAGMNAVTNLRLEFVDISGNANRAKKAAMVTIMAYGTGYCSEQDARDAITG